MQASADTHKVEMPAVGVMCVIIGCFSIVIGAIIRFVALSQMAHPAPDTASGIATGIALIFSSVIWFATSRAFALLAQIAHNTARPKANEHPH